MTRLLSLLAVLLLPLTLSACPMQTENRYRHDPVDPNEPLRYATHGFDVMCYSVYACKAWYDNRLVTDLVEVTGHNDELAPSFESLDGEKNISNIMGGNLGTPNFPPPAKVEWQSKDKTWHTAEVDIGAIFKDQVIHHKAPRNELDDEFLGGLEPSIVLVVDNRQIRVYMHTQLASKHETIPGNPNSKFYDDPVLMYSKDY